MGNFWKESRLILTIRVWNKEDTSENSGEGPTGGEGESSLVIVSGMQGASERP